MEAPDLRTSLSLVIALMSSHNHSAAEVTCSDVAYELAHSPTATPSAGNLNVHLIDQFESRDPAILKAGLLFAAAILSVIGNGTSLAVIWKTPKLHTKTFALLFNVAAVDLFAGLVLIWKGVYNIVVYVLNDDPCKYLIVVAIVAFAARYPVYLSMCSVGLIAYERYIAVVRPLRYETLVTDKTIKVAVAFVWITCLPLTGTFLILLGRIDWATCTLSGLVRQALITDATCLITIFTVIAGLHGHMLIIALQQQAKISAEVR